MKKCCSGLNNIHGNETHYDGYFEDSALLLSMTENPIGFFVVLS